MFCRPLRSDFFAAGVGGCSVWWLLLLKRKDGYTHAPAGFARDALSPGNALGQMPQLLGSSGPGASCSNYRSGRLCAVTDPYIQYNSGVSSVLLGGFARSGGVVSGLAPDARGCAVSPATTPDGCLDRTVAPISKAIFVGEAGYKTSRTLIVGATDTFLKPSHCPEKTPTTGSSHVSLQSGGNAAQQIDRVHSWSVT